MSNGTGASDPSVGDYADTSSAELGRRMSERPMARERDLSSLFVPDDYP
jgi:hypothetical protein